MSRERSWKAALSATLLSSLRGVASYDMVRDYSGLDFFSRWDFYGSYDNLTLGGLHQLLLPRFKHAYLVEITGDVWWLDESDATSQGLAYTDDAGHAIIKVDNTSNVAYNDKRNSVRLLDSAYKTSALTLEC